MNTNDEYELGYTPNNLKKIREKYRLTQSAVGKITNNALRTIQSWEMPEEAENHVGMPHRKWILLLKQVQNKSD